MNRRLLIAGLLALFTAAVHIFIGTPEVHRPLLESLLSPELKLVLYACWHLVSVMLVFSGVFLLRACAASRRNINRELVIMLGLSWVAYGLVFFRHAASTPAMDAAAPCWYALFERC